MPVQFAKERRHEHIHRVDLSMRDLGPMFDWLQSDECGGEGTFDTSFCYATPWGHATSAAFHFSDEMTALLFKMKFFG